MASPAAARLRVVAAAVLFSTGGAAIKACSLTGAQVACVRSGIAALTVLALLPAARRRWRWSTLAIGGAYAATMILFVQANKLTTAASTIFLQATSPLYILLLGPWLLREPVRRRDVGFMAALAGGMAMFFVGTGPHFATAPDPLRGNLAAAMSGALWAVTVTGLRWTARRDGASGDAGAAGGSAGGSVETVVVAGNTIAFAACLPLALPLSGAGAADWAVVIYLGVVQIGLAYIFLTRGMREVTALEASLLLLVEPVLNPIWAWLVQGETPGAWSVAGGAIILTATAVRTWLDASRAASP